MMALFSLKLDATWNPSAVTMEPLMALELLMACSDGRSRGFMCVKNITLKNAINASMMRRKKLRIFFFLLLLCECI
jgi:hypothetical protein